MDGTFESRAEQLAAEFASQSTTVEELNQLMRRLMMKSGLERMLDMEMDVHLGRKPSSSSLARPLRRRFLANVHPIVATTKSGTNPGTQLWEIRGKSGEQNPGNKTEFELNSIRNDPARLATIRSRLSDISWWMRLLSQNIAQRANRDDNEVGKFWQARYRAVRLLDETAVLACAAYVDLNPIRAAICKTLEGSDFTSVQKRMAAIAAVHGADKAAQPARVGTPGKDTEFVAANCADTEKPVKVDAKVMTDAFLAPLEIDERSDAIGPCSHFGGTRASDKGFLPMTIGAYIELLDWTTRQIRKDKRGSTPQTIGPNFERLGISGEMWCGLVKDFGRLFYAVAGQPQQIDTRRSRDGNHRYKTKRQTRELMQAS